MFWADQTYKPKIDDFCCSPSRAVFRPGKEFITAPITQVLKMSGIDTSKQEDLDSFILKPKKCYHLDKHNGVKIHIIRYPPVLRTSPLSKGDFFVLLYLKELSRSD